MIKSDRWRYLVSRSLRICKSVLRFAYNKLHAFDQKIGVGFDLSTHNYLIRRTAFAYDMVNAPDESYYARHYGDFIAEELISNGLSSATSLHDLACGQGRIIKELLGRGLSFASIKGVDFSGEVLASARENFDDTLLDSTIHFETSDVLTYVRNAEDASVDVLLLLEVLYMLPNPENVLAEVARILKSTGIAFFSVRTDYYYGLSLVRQGLFQKLDCFHMKTSEELFDSGVKLNWTCSDKIFSKFSNSYGLNVKRCTAIGGCSGIPKDPLASIVRPSELSSKDQDSLLKLEKFLGEKYPDNGRYLLFSAVKA